MNSLVREVLQRLPKKSEWVFTKPNGTPYTAVRGFDKTRKATGLTDKGFIRRLYNEKSINNRRVNQRLVWRGDGVAERAGLENRRWGNSSASSNLAPSAIHQ